jgi:hypothetical protein
MYKDELNALLVKEDHHLLMTGLKYWHILSADFPKHLRSMV